MFMKDCKPNFLSFRCVGDGDGLPDPEDYACSLDVLGEHEAKVLEMEGWYEDEWKLQAKKAGMIKRIYCENFMGHRELHIDLCRNVNIISEKGNFSTIFTAINACFGANASQLGVVGHLRELVVTPTENKNSGHTTIGRVCVTIENGGDNGFERDIYGDEISVERYFSKVSGCYGYKLLDCDGVEQSRSKNELFSMLSHLNIGTNNPAAILKQARAKRVGQPKDMYRFFTNASGMDVVQDTYNFIAQELENYEAVREDLAISVKEKEKKVAKLEKEWEQERQTLMNRLFRGMEKNGDSSSRSAVDVHQSYSDAVSMLDAVRHNFEMLDQFKASHSDKCQNYQQAKNDLEANQDMLYLVGNEISRLEEDLRARTKRLKKEQSYLLTLASVVFDECMQLMDASGKLHLDFENGELSLAVNRSKSVNFEDEEEPQIAREKDEAFKSMAFLLSISEPLGYPIHCSLLHPRHCLDLLERLLDCSSMFSNRQFIFLAPADIPRAIEADRRLKITRL